MTISDNMLVRDGLQVLKQRMPPKWHVSTPARSTQRGETSRAKVTGPDKQSITLSLRPATALQPRDVLALPEPNVEGRDARGVLVLAPYLSHATQARLRERKFNYLDLTGNVWLLVSQPGLYIDVQGAVKPPERAARSTPSLKGEKAGRVVRALVDHTEPLGVRRLAEATGIDAGYVSRIVAFLDAETLITRVGHGRIATVDWRALLRRWATAAPLEARGEIVTYLDPRGQVHVRDLLRKQSARYAVTGTMAAARFAPIVPARVMTIWARDAADLAERLDLRPAKAGANVLLIEPEGDSVFDGATSQDDVTYAAPSQVAADLLTSPGRGPAEAEELIAWMQQNEPAWRQ